MTYKWGWYQTLINWDDPPRCGFLLTTLELSRAFRCFRQTSEQKQTAHSLACMRFVFFLRNKWSVIFSCLVWFLGGSNAIKKTYRCKKNILEKTATLQGTNISPWFLAYLSRCFSKLPVWWDMYPFPGGYLSLCLLASLNGNCQWFTNFPKPWAKTRWRNGDVASRAAKRAIQNGAESWGVDPPINGLGLLGSLG